MQAAAFRQSGYLTFPAMLDSSRLQIIEAVLNRTEGSAASARQMLRFDWCVQLANEIRNTLISTRKDGALFVQPPSTVLENLVALRFHIDECGAEDGALKLVPGSHRLGRVSDADKARLRDELGEVIGAVEKGGAMAMSPLLLHASSKATGGSRRRVLHFMFGPPALPYGLEWPQAPATGLR